MDNSKSNVLGRRCLSHNRYRPDYVHRLHDCMNEGYMSVSYSFIISRRVNKTKLITVSPCFPLVLLIKSLYAQ